MARDRNHEDDDQADFNLDDGGDEQEREEGFDEGSDEFEEGEEGEEGDESGEGHDPETLRQIANEGHRTVPTARLNAEIERRKAAERALELAHASIGAGRQQQQEPQPQAAFDRAAKIRERNKALLDGDEELAAKIEEEIDADRQRIADERAAERAAQTIERTRVEETISEAVENYPFISEKHPDHDPEVLADIEMYRDRYLREGKTLSLSLIHI